MNNILIRPPSFIKGNIGDEALIITLKYLLVNKNLIFLKNEQDINNLSLNNIDCLIYFGNDTLGYYNISKYIINTFIKFNKNIYFINTSWGNNVIETNKLYLKKICTNKNVYFFIRDKVSLQLIKNDIQFKNEPLLTSDLAFLCPSKNTFKNNDLEIWVNNQTKNIIGINIHQDFKNLNDLVINNLLLFIKKYKNKYVFLFIPHDKRKNEFEFMKSIQQKVENSFICTYLEPCYEKYILSKLFCIITCRMHLSILTLSNITPNINICYNGTKAIGLFSLFNLEKFVICPKNITSIFNLFFQIENNYLEYQYKIKSRLNYIKLLSNKQLYFIK